MSSGSTPTGPVSPGIEDTRMNLHSGRSCAGERPPVLSLRTLRGAAGSACSDPPCGQYEAVPAIRPWLLLLLLLLLYPQPAPVEAVRGHRSLEVSYPLSVTQVVVCSRALWFLLSICVREKQRSVGSFCSAPVGRRRAIDWRGLVGPPGPTAVLL